MIKFEGISITEENGVKEGSIVEGTGYTDFLNVYGNERKGLWLWSDYSWIEIKPDTFEVVDG